jgi:hypothetical protein
LLLRIKYIPIFLFTSIIASCQTTTQKIKDTSETIIEEVIDVSNQKDTTSFIYSWKNEFDYNASLINIIKLPEGYIRKESEKTSFECWLRHLPVNIIDNEVYLYNGDKKYNQNAQFKVIDIDVGNKDLQQCADAVMRLRAEYLYSSGDYDKIHFNYTNGTKIPFSKWSSGYYPSLKGNKVIWTTSANDKSYKSFRKYMSNIFMYAGTASLEKELKSVTLSEIQAGDILIKGGFPGHAVLVIDVVTNEETRDKSFLIAQSYMPAQSIHILRNPMNDKISPWYSVNEIEDVIETPEWTFYSNQLKRFVD